MFSEMVAESMFGLADVQEPTSGTLDAVDQVRGCTCEHLSHLEGLSKPMDGVEGTVMTGVSLRVPASAVSCHFLLGEKDKTSAL